MGLVELVAEFLLGGTLYIQKYREHMCKEILIWDNKFSNQGFMKIYVMIQL